jgi:quercetin dioxygenase-like cupin family protein
MLPKSSRVLVGVLTAVSVISLHLPLAAQGADEKPIVAPAASAKFGAIPNAPKCFTVAVERGDPGIGPSVILAKFTPGCIAPFHWHTPSETAMVVSGSLEVQMKDDKAFVGHHGDYVYLPSHHVHRATCQGSAPCLVFLTSDAAFDVHWVDAAGQEIPLEAAMKNAKQAAKPHSAKP